MTTTTFALSFGGTAANVHKRGTTSANAIQRALKEAKSGDVVIVTYCVNTTMPYTVCFKVTDFYIEVENPPVTVLLEKKLLQMEECQEYLHKAVKAALEA